MRRGGTEGRGWVRRIWARQFEGSGCSVEIYRVGRETPRGGGRGELGGGEEFRRIWVTTAAGSGLSAVNARRQEFGKNTHTARNQGSHGGI